MLRKIKFVHANSSAEFSNAQNQEPIIIPVQSESVLQDSMDISQNTTNNTPHVLPPITSASQITNPISHQNFDATASPHINIASSQNLKTITLNQASNYELPKFHTPDNQGLPDLNSSIDRTTDFSSTPLLLEKNKDIPETSNHQKKKKQPFRTHIKRNRAQFVNEIGEDFETEAPGPYGQDPMGNMGHKFPAANKIMKAIEVIQELCGTKHPESRQLAESMYQELTQKLLMQKDPKEISNKLNPAKLKPTHRIFRDSFINPALVRKNSSTELKLPEDLAVRREPMNINKNKTNANVVNNIQRTFRVQTDLRMRASNPSLPNPSSVKDLLTHPSYADAVDKKMEEERENNFSGSRITMANRQIKSVALNHWNNSPDADVRRLRLAKLSKNIREKAQMVGSHTSLGHHMVPRRTFRRQQASTVELSDSQALLQAQEINLSPTKGLKSGVQILNLGLSGQITTEQKIGPSTMMSFGKNSRKSSEKLVKDALAGQQPNSQGIASPPNERTNPGMDFLSSQGSMQIQHKYNQTTQQSAQAAADNNYYENAKMSRQSSGQQMPLRDKANDPKEDEPEFAPARHPAPEITHSQERKNRTPLLTKTTAGGIQLEGHTEGRNSYQSPTSAINVRSTTLVHRYQANASSNTDLPIELQQNRDVQRAIRGSYQIGSTGRRNDRLGSQVKTKKSYSISTLQIDGPTTGGNVPQKQIRKSEKQQSSQNTKNFTKWVPVKMLDTNNVKGNYQVNYLSPTNNNLQNNGNAFMKGERIHKRMSSQTQIQPGKTAQNKNLYEPTHQNLTNQTDLSIQQISQRDN